MNIPFGKPTIGSEEKRAVERVLDSGILVNGKNLPEFEKLFALFTGAPYAVGVSNCTAAMHMAYVHFGIGPGDEVIIPAQTHAATGHAVELSGARPVFVDSVRETGNINIDAVHGAITEKTRAICVVHYLGMPVDMSLIVEIANRYGLIVIEDCALALGTRWKNVHAGLWGDVGCFSFYPAKHITTGEGGMVITRDEGTARGIQNLRAFGMDKNFNERRVPGMYNMTSLGFNYRMSEISAAMGIEQMKKLVSFLSHRYDIYNQLREGLQGVSGVEVFRECDENEISSHYCMAFLVSGDRTRVQQYLRKRGIGTSIHYPHPVPRMRYYSDKYGFSPGDFPVAEYISDHSIVVSTGPHVNKTDCPKIVGGVRAGSRI